MNTNDELRQQMWELAYGLLSSDEVAALHAQIKSDPVAARLYAEVRLQADLVADAAKVSDPSVQFQPQGEPAIIRPMPAKRGSSAGAVAKASSAKGVNGLVGLAGTALAALLCVVFFRPTPSGDQLAQQFVVTTVEAPARLQAGVSQEVSVYTCDIDNVAKPAEVEVRLVDATGQEQQRWNLRTDEQGRGNVELPGQAIQDGVRVEVTATTDQRNELDSASKKKELTVAFDTEVVPEPVETYVMLDKPAYERGETVNFALRKVKRFSKELVNDPDDSLADAEEKAMEETSAGITQWSAQMGQGLVTGAFQLEGSADPSLLAPMLQSRLAGNIDETGDQQELYFFHQWKDSLPRLAKRQVEAEQLAAIGRFGSISGDSRELNRSRGMLAADAAAPPAPGAAFAATEPKDKADAVRNGESDDSLERTKTEVDLLAKKQLGKEEVIAAGEAIKVPVPADVSGRLLVTAKCADRFVASEHFILPQQEARKSEDSTRLEVADAVKEKTAEGTSVTLNPAPEADGEILVNVYDDSQQPPQLVAAHRYYREPEQRLNVDLKGLKDYYAAGERVKLRVQVVDEKSQPVDATLAVRVWNERLVQAAGSPVADLASTFFSDRGTLEADGTKLALGVLRQGGFAGGAGGQAAGAGGGEFAGGVADQPLGGNESLAFRSPAEALDAVQQRESLLGDEGSRRLEASNLTAVKAAYETAVSEAREAAAARKANIGRLLLIGGFAVLVLLGMQALLRASAKASIWLPAVAVAAASLMIGAMWLNPSFETGEIVQTAAVPEQKPVEAPVDGPVELQRSSEASPDSSTSAAGDETNVRRFDNRDMHDGQRSVKLQDQDDESVDSKNTSPPPPRDADADVAGRQEDLKPFAFKALNDAPAGPSAPTPAMPAPAAPQAAPMDAPPAPAADASKFAESGTRRPADPKASNGPLPPSKLETAESATVDAAGASPDSRSKSAQRGRVEGAAKALDPAVVGVQPSAEKNEQQRRMQSAPPAATAAKAANSTAPSEPEGSRDNTGLPPPAPAVAGTARSSGGGADRPGQAVDLQANQPRPDANVPDSPPSKSGMAGNRGGYSQPEKKQGENELRSRAARSLVDREVQSLSSLAPASLLFEPALATDSKGQATVEFTLPDVDCEYRVLIDAIGHGRIGSLQQVIVGRAEAKTDE